MSQRTRGHDERILLRDGRDRDPRVLPGACRPAVGGRRSADGPLEGSVRAQGKILLAAIAACVLVPMAGEVAALMALTGIPSPYMMGLTWLGLGWSTATFAAISIAELWKLCRDREEKDPQTAIPSISAGERPLEGVPDAIPHVEVRSASQADLPSQTRLDRGPPRDHVRRARYGSRTPAGPGR